MNVKANFSDLQRAACSDMLEALRAGDDPAYERSAAEARRLIEAQVAEHLAAQAALAPEAQDVRVRPGYAAGIAAYAAASTPDQRDRRFDELCLLRAEEIVADGGDPDPEANLFDLYDIDGQVRKIIEESGKIEVTA